MENYIVYSKTKDEFFIIAHACPGKTGEFQWYLVDDPNETKEEVLEGQIYESITLSNTKIKKLYEGKWLCCRCKVDGDVYDEGCLYLTDSFLDMILENQFDNVAFFDKNGMIRGSQYVKKEEKELGTGCLNYSLGIDENAPYCKEECMDRRKSIHGGHMLMKGDTGTGKSSLMKKEILQILQNSDDSIYIFDQVGIDDYEKFSDIIHLIHYEKESGYESTIEKTRIYDEILEKGKRNSAKGKHIWVYFDDCFRAFTLHDWRAFISFLAKAKNSNVILAVALQTYLDIPHELFEIFVSHFEYHKELSCCKENERKHIRNPEYLYEGTFDFWWNGWNYNLEVQMPVKYGTIETAKQDKSSCRFEKRDGHVVLVIYSGWEQGMKDGKWYEHVAGEELAVYRWEDWYLWKMTKAKEKELSGMIDAIQDYLPYAENWNALFGVKELPEGWGLTPESLAYRIISYVN